MTHAASPSTEMHRHLDVMRRRQLPGWLLDAVDPEQCAAALGERIGDLVPGAEALRRVTVESARARSWRWAMRYSADVTTDDGERQVSLVAELQPPGRAPDRPTTVTGPAITLPGIGLTVQAVGTDPGLPALPALADPASARVRLEHALRGPTRPGLRLVDVRPRVSRYKPGHRATLVYQLQYPAGADPTWPRAVVAKTYRGEEGAATFAAMRALWSSPLGGVAATPRLAEPLAYLPDARTLLQGMVPGDRTLTEVAQRVAGADRDGSGPGVARQAAARLEAALLQTAAGLAALHGCGAQVCVARDLPAEVSAVRRLLARVAPTLPDDTATAVGRLLDALAKRGCREDAPEPGVVHGAFRPAQVLLDGPSVGFIDFDSAGIGEAALDIGRFTARFGELWLVASPAGDGEALERQRALAGMFVQQYREHAPLSAARATTWQCLDLVGSVVRSWARVQPARAEVLLDLLEVTLPDAA